MRSKRKAATALDGQDSNPLRCVFPQQEPADTRAIQTERKKSMITTVTLTCALDADQIRRENSPEEIAEFVMKIEAAMNSESWTESLIIRMAEVMAPYVKTSTMRRIGQHITKLEGYEP
jgi:hypothetical protein